MHKNFNSNISYAIIVTFYLNDQEIDQVDINAFRFTLCLHLYLYFLLSFFCPSYSHKCADIVRTACIIFPTSLYLLRAQVVN